MGSSESYNNQGDSILEIGMSLEQDATRALTQQLNNVVTDMSTAFTKMEAVAKKLDFKKAIKGLKDLSLATVDLQEAFNKISFDKVNKDLENLSSQMDTVKSKLIDVGSLVNVFDGKPLKIEIDIPDTERLKILNEVLKNNKANKPIIIQGSDDQFELAGVAAGSVIGSMRQSSKHKRKQGFLERRKELNALLFEDNNFFDIDTSNVKDTLFSPNDVKNKQQKDDYRKDKDYSLSATSIFEDYEGFGRRRPRRDVSGDETIWDTAWNDKKFNDKGIKDDLKTGVKDNEGLLSWFTGQGTETNDNKEKKTPALKVNWEEFKNVGREVFKIFIGDLQDVARVIKTITGIAKNVSKFITKAIKTMYNFAKGLVNLIKSIFKTIGNIVKGLVNLIVNIFKSIFNALAAVLKKAIDILLIPVRFLADMFHRLFSAISKFLSIGNVASKLQEIFGAISTAVRDIRPSYAQEVYGIGENDRIRYKRVADFAGIGPDTAFADMVVELYHLRAAFQGWGTLDSNPAIAALGLEEEVLLGNRPTGEVLTNVLASYMERMQDIWNDPDTAKKPEEERVDIMAQRLNFLNTTLKDIRGLENIPEFANNLFTAYRSNPKDFNHKPREFIDWVMAGGIRGKNNEVITMQSMVRATEEASKNILDMATALTAELRVNQDLISTLDALNKTELERLAKDRDPKTRISSEELDNMSRPALEAAAAAGNNSAIIQLALLNSTMEKLNAKVDRVKSLSGTDPDTALKLDQLAEGFENASLAALYAYMYSVNEAVRVAVQGMGGANQTYANEDMQKLQGLFDKDAIKAAFGELAVAFEDLKSNLEYLQQNLLTKYTPAIKSVVSYIGEVATALTSGIVTGDFTTFHDLFIDMVQKLMDLLASPNPLKNMATKLKDIFGYALDDPDPFGLDYLFTGVKSLWEQYGGAIIDNLKLQGLEILYAFLTDWLPLIIKGVNTMWNGIKDFFDKNKDTLKALGSNMFAVVVDVLGLIALEGIALMQRIFADTDLWDKIKNVLRAVGGVMLATIKFLIDTLKPHIMNFITSVGDYIMKVFSNILDYFKSMRVTPEGILFGKQAELYTQFTEELHKFRGSEGLYMNAGDKAYMNNSAHSMSSETYNAGLSKTLASILPKNGNNGTGSKVNIALNAFNQRFGKDGITRLEMLGLMTNVIGMQKIGLGLDNNGKARTSFKYTPAYKGAKETSIELHTFMGLIRDSQGTVVDQIVDGSVPSGLFGRDTKLLSKELDKNGKNIVYGTMGELFPFLFTKENKYNETYKFGRGDVSSYPTIGEYFNSPTGKENTPLNKWLGLISGYSGNPFDNSNTSEFFALSKLLADNDPLSVGGALLNVLGLDEIAEALTDSKEYKDAMAALTGATNLLTNPIATQAAITTAMAKTNADVNATIANLSKLVADTVGNLGVEVNNNSTTTINLTIDVGGESKTGTIIIGKDGVKEDTLGNVIKLKREYNDSKAAGLNPNASRQPSSVGETDTNNASPPVAGTDGTGEGGE